MQETRGPTFVTGYEHLTLAQRLLRVLHAPRSAYQAVGDEPSGLDWFIPIIILAAIWIGSNYLTLSVLANPDLPAYQEKWVQLTAEQQALTQQGLEQYTDFGWYMTPIVNSFFSLAAVALVLLALARLAFQSEVSLKQMMTVKAYASVIAMVELIVRTPLVLEAQTPEVSFGLGSLLSEEMAATSFGRILAGADLFVLWQAIILGLGLGVMGRIPLQRSVPAVVMLWALWITSGALLSSFSTPPPQVAG